MYRHPNRQQQQRGMALRLPEPADVGQMAVRAAQGFARRNPVITGGYLFGLLVLILGGSGIRLSLQQRYEYNRIMDTIDLQAEYRASDQYARALHSYRATKGWFTCDGLCQRNKDRMEQAKQTLDAIREEGRARMSDAKAVAGLWSEVGVGQVKDSFWSYFTEGKQFAKRQTMWDALFMGIRTMSRNREESMVEFGIRLLMQLLVNFSLGLVMALLFFVLGLWSIIRDYQANPVVAVVFFVTCSCAAFAFVTSYLLAIYGAAAGGVYGLAKLTEMNTRARINEERRQQYMYNRPHYD